MVVCVMLCLCGDVVCDDVMLCVMLCGDVVWGCCVVMLNVMVYVM